MSMANKQLGIFLVYFSVPAALHPRHQPLKSRQCARVVEKSRTMARYLPQGQPRRKQPQLDQRLDAQRS